VGGAPLQLPPCCAGFGSGPGLASPPPSDKHTDTHHMCVERHESGEEGTMSQSPGCQPIAAVAAQTASLAAAVCGCIVPRRLQLAAECTCYGRPTEQEWLYSASGMAHQPRGGALWRCGSSPSAIKVTTTCRSRSGTWPRPHTTCRQAHRLCAYWRARGVAAVAAACWRPPASGRQLAAGRVAVPARQQAAGAAVGSWGWAVCMDTQWLACQAYVSSMMQPSPSVPLGWWRAIRQAVSTHPALLGVCAPSCPFPGGRGRG
jgi:hypothetical protein